MRNSEGYLIPVFSPLALEQLKSRMRPINVDDFFRMAKELHGFDLKPQIDEEDEPCSIDFEELDAIADDLDFMGKPFFCEGKVTLATAKEGVGKSMFSMLLALMISTGGSIGQIISAKKQYKTYILDAENAKHDFLLRIKKMLCNFHDEKAIKDNLRYDCLRDSEKEHIDLSSPEDQQWVRKRIGISKFVVFDNLDELCSSKVITNEDRWKNLFRTFFKPLAKEGRSVLLIHHENKNGEHRGTGKIPDAMDVVLSLKKPDKCTDEKTIIDIYAKKGRNIYGKQRRPLQLEFYDEDGRIKYRIETIHENSDKNQPTSILTDEEAQRHQIQAAMIEAARIAAQNTDLESIERFIKKKDIKGLLPDSADTTITNHFNILCDEEVLIKKGSGKGTKYYLFPGPDSFPKKE